MAPSKQNSDLKGGISFIVPTLNRRRWVKRAIDSCLACGANGVRPHVIVIESQSDDGTFSFLQEVYGRDDRVTLIQNSRSDGCVESWLQGVPHVQTRFSTFMFDDDALSPYFDDLVAHMTGDHCDFAIAQGAAHDIKNVYDFKPIGSFEIYPRDEVLSAYFGVHQLSKFPSLPVSPICCAVASELLFEWERQVRLFAVRNQLRRYFMLKRGIGPDLMIYLVALLEGRGQVLMTESVVAQFSAHPDSISIKAKAFELALGYWLARIWAFERVAEKGHRTETAEYGACLLVFGFRLVIMQLLRGKVSWLKSIMAEVWRVLAVSVRTSSLGTTWLAIIRIALRKAKERIKGRRTIPLAVGV